MVKEPYNSSPDLARPAQGYSHINLLHDLMELKRLLFLSYVQSKEQLPKSSQMPKHQFYKMLVFDQS